MPFSVSWLGLSDGDNSGHPQGTMPFGFTEFLHLFSYKNFGNFWSDVTSSLYVNFVNFHKLRKQQDFFQYPN